MTQAHQEHAWDHTAEIVAMLFNVNRGDLSAPVMNPREINPYRAARAQVETEPLSDEQTGELLAGLAKHGF